MHSTQLSLELSPNCPSPQMNCACYFLSQTSQSLYSRASLAWGLFHSLRAILLSVQFSSVAQSCLTLCDPLDCSTQGFPANHQLPEPSSHLILCHSLLLLPSSFPSIRVSSNESALHIRGPKYWSISFSISPSNEYSGLTSLRMDWLDLLAVPGTLKSLLQHQSSKASVLRRSAFFMVQLSHPYVTGKIINSVQFSQRDC